MKKYIVSIVPVFFLSLVIIFSSGCKNSSCGSGGACGAKVAASPEHGIGTLTVEALDTLLQSGVPVVVLDARSGKYDDGRRIPGAKSLTDQASAEAAAKLIPAKDALVVTYCSNPKCPASDRLAKHLQTLGYKNIVELPAGIQGWSAAGKPVAKAK